MRHSYKEIPAASFNIDDLHFHCEQPTQPTGAPEGKIPIRLGSPQKVEIFEGLRPMNPTKDVFEIFADSFGFRGLAYHYALNQENLETTLKRVFQRANLMPQDLRDYFLDKIRQEFLMTLKNDIDRKTDFQSAFEAQVANLKLVKRVDDSSPIPVSNLRLNPDKIGAKTDLLRILDALYELHFFTNGVGQVATKESVMKAFGEFLGNDFSAFANVLSQSYNNTSLATNLAIFEHLKAKIQEKHNQRT